jgi:hypothetical protein
MPLSSESAYHLAGSGAADAGAAVVTGAGALADVDPASRLGVLWRSPPHPASSSPATTTGVIVARIRGA